MALRIREDIITWLCRQAAVDSCRFAGCGIEATDQTATRCQSRNLELM